MKKLLFVLLALCLYAIPSCGQIINVFGDSYVANHAMSKNDTWHSKMAEKLGLKYNNYGKNGACVAFDRTHDGKYNFGPAMWQKTKSLDPAADYVLIIAGHNDAVKVGANADSLAMFRDSLDLMIRNVRVQCPKAWIGYVTPWYVQHDGFDQVCGVIRDVCRGYGIPVLDNCTPECIIKVRDEEFRKQYFQSPKDTAHLNPAGHDLFLTVAMPWFVSNAMGQQ